jgi:hypothetical protein
MGLRSVSFTKFRDLSRETMQCSLISPFVETFDCSLIGTHNQVDDGDCIQVYLIFDLLEDLTVMLPTICSLQDLKKGCC